MHKTANQIIDEMNLDDEVKRISKEELDYYRNNIYECSVDILRVLYGELLQENEKLKEIDLTTVFIQGAYDEKTRWKQKIKKKIQELKIEEKTRLKGKGCFDRCLILSEYQYKENVLQELLKGE